MSWDKYYLTRIVMAYSLERPYACLKFIYGSVNATSWRRYVNLTKLRVDT